MKNSRFHTVFSVIMILLALAVVSVPWIVQLAAGDTPASEDSGLTEKRTLSEFPSDYSNDWFSRFESFYSDHSPARQRLITLETDTALGYDSFYRKNVNPVLTRLIVKQNAGSVGDATDAPDENTTKQPEATVDLSLIIGLNTPEPTPELTDTPEPTAEPTAEPTQEKTPDGTQGPEVTGTPEPTPEPTQPPTPTPTPHVHQFDNGKVKYGASCVSEGEKVYTCTICGETKTEKIPKIAHKYVIKKQSTADPDNYGYTLKKCSVCGAYSLEDVVAKPVDSSYLAPEYKGGAIFGRRDWLFYSGDDSEGYYRGTNILSDAEMEAWKNKFEQLDNVCKAKDIELVIMVAPNKEQIYPEYMPTYQIVSQTKRQDVFLEYMNSHSTVKYVYPKTELNTTKIFYDVFYKQDTHWNALGGFTGAMAIYRALGISVTNVFDLKVAESTRTGGDLSNFCGFSTTYRNWGISYKDNISTSAEYFENHVTSSKTELSQFTTPGATYADKKIVVLGDSFRHALSAIISKDFGKSTFAHRKELSYSTAVVVNALRELGEGDVLVLTCVERYDGQLVSAADQLIGILKR